MVMIHFLIGTVEAGEQFKWFLAQITNIKIPKETSWNIHTLDQYGSKYIFDVEKDSCLQYKDEYKRKKQTTDITNSKFQNGKSDDLPPTQSSRRYVSFGQLDGDIMFIIHYSHMLDVVCPRLTF